MKKENVSIKQRALGLLMITAGMMLVWLPLIPLQYETNLFIRIFLVMLIPIGLLISVIGFGVLDPESLECD